jgi:hypothetical protein
MSGTRSLDELQVAHMPSQDDCQLHVAQGGGPASASAWARGGARGLRRPVVLDAITLDAVVDDGLAHAQPRRQASSALVVTTESLPSPMPCEHLANLRADEYLRETAPKTHDDSGELCRRIACTSEVPHPSGDDQGSKTALRAASASALVLERRPRMWENQARLRVGELLSKYGISQRLNHRLIDESPQGGNRVSVIDQKKEPGFNPPPPI